MTAPPPPALPPQAQPPRLLDQSRAAARAAGQPEPWIEPLTGWITAFIVLHGKRHPRERRAAEALRCREPVAATDPAPVASLGPASAHAGADSFHGPPGGPRSVKRVGSDTPRIKAFRPGAFHGRALRRPCETRNEVGGSCRPGRRRR